MLEHRSSTQRVAIAKSGVIIAIVCYMLLGAIRKEGSVFKDVQCAEVFAELNRRRYWQVFEVLGAENDYFPLGYEEGDLVFCLSREVAKLIAVNNGALEGVQVLDVSARAEIRKSRISDFGMFVMLEGFG